MAKLYFYYSSMNAGKTTTLLQSSYNYQERGMNTLLFTASLDFRYGVGLITSRIGLKMPAVLYDHDFDFFHYIKDKRHVLPNLKCIMVDEAHFLSKAHVRQLCDVVDQLSLPVLAYGLRTDFLGETFEGSRHLLAWADELVEIKTICHCGAKATMNVRVNELGEVETSGDQIEIGGDSRYVSVCRKHFYLSQASPLDRCVLSDKIIEKIA